MKCQCNKSSCRRKKQRAPDWKRNVSAHEFTNEPAINCHNLSVTGDVVNLIFCSILIN